MSSTVYIEIKTCLISVFVKLLQVVQAARTYNVHSDMNEEKIKSPDTNTFQSRIFVIQINPYSALVLDVCMPRYMMLSMNEIFSTVRHRNCVGTHCVSYNTLLCLQVPISPLERPKNVICFINRSLMRANYRLKAN